MNALTMVIALVPLKYQGKRIEEGVEFAVHEDDIEQLLDDNLIAFSGDSLPTSDGAARTNQRVLDLIEAIEMLDKDDPSLWTKEGKPKTEALLALGDFGIDVSAALRDDVWASMQAD